MIQLMRQDSCTEDMVRLFIVLIKGGKKALLKAYDTEALHTLRSKVSIQQLRSQCCFFKCEQNVSKLLF